MQSTSGATATAGRRSKLPASDATVALIVSEEEDTSAAAVAATAADADDEDEGERSGDWRPAMKDAAQQSDECCIPKTQAGPTFLNEPPGPTLVWVKSASGPR